MPTTVPGPRERVAAIGAVLGDVAATTVTRIEEMHGGIASRAFATTPGSLPVRLAHDAIARGVYAGVRGGVRLAGRAAGGAAALGPAAQRDPIAGRRARTVLGAVSGIWGDALAHRHPALAITMSVRHAGADVPLTASALRRSTGSPTPRLAVFLHGLCETDESWGSRRRLRGGDHGELLRTELGLTPVLLRYNSGLPVAENGRLLDDLLERLTAVWPGGITELHLIGHSMGGLVIRSACTRAAERGDDGWVARVRNCVYLGTPHDGAPLARGVAIAAAALRRLPETRALGSVLDLHSAGVRDLRRGLRGSAPLLPSAHHHGISASLGDTPDHLLSRLLGDLLVLPASAVGGPQALIEAERHRHIGGVSHFDLLRHPDVGEALVEWLATEPETARSA